MAGQQIGPQVVGPGEITNFPQGQRTTRLADYAPFIGTEGVERIAEKVQALKGLDLQIINSTKQGGGVAEILHSLVPLMNGAGLKARWETITGPPTFYEITKSIHNMLQGKEGELSSEDKSHYEETAAGNAGMIRDRSDVVVVHDPQPLPLIHHRKGGRRWIWRCHLDLSTPNASVRDYLVPMVDGYDAAIFTLPAYALPVSPPAEFIWPAIDPFTQKNRRMDTDQAMAYLRRYGIPLDRPIVTQISRYDHWKDPVGVIKACKLAQQEVDFTLVLLGNFASDDPEGEHIYEQLIQSQDERVKILIDGDDQLLVNALQSVAEVVLQKSLREGFGLTVTEAMWKGRAVIGGRTSGIAAQIDDGYNGYLVSSIDETAERIVRILRDPELSDYLGRNARQTVIEKFLLSRLLEQYADLLTV